MRIPEWRLAALCSLALTVGACGSSDLAGDLPPNAAASGTATLKCALPASGSEFEARDAEALNLDPAAVAEATRYADLTNAVSIRVYRYGCLAGTGALDPLTGGIPNNVWSTTKGVVSLLTGRAAQLGYLDLDDPIGKYVTEADAEHGAVTIRQMLTQSSGLRFVWTGDLNLGNPDSVRYTLALPFDFAPGTEFTYGQSTVTLLAHTVERAVGEDLQAFAQRELFDKVGIARDDWFWLRDRAGHTHGYAFLFTAPKNLARLGHLMLDRGRWNGEQLLAPEYVSKAGRASSTNGFYGYLLWSNEGDSGYTVEIPDSRELQRPLIASAPRDLFAFVGFLDQIVFVIPSLDMVVVRTGYPGNYTLELQETLTAHSGKWMHEFFRILMRGVRDQAIADPGPYVGNDFVALDLQYFADPATVLGSLALGPQAPEDCNLLGCDGGISYAGLLQAVPDIVSVILGQLGLPGIEAP